MTWTIVLNLFSIAVMGGVLVYAFRLDRRLSALDRNRSEMEKFVADFTKAIARAERAITELQDTTSDSGIEVERHMNRAAGLRDELTFLIDAADKIATRITDQTSEAQKTKRGAQKPAVEEKPAETPVEAKETPSVPTPISTTPPWLRAPRQEKVMARQTEPTPPPAPVPAPREEMRPLSRSQAEKDLQQALDKMR